MVECYLWQDSASLLVSWAQCISSCDFRLGLRVTLLPFLSTCVYILKLHNILNEFTNMILPKFQKDDEKEIMNPTQNLLYSYSYCILSVIKVLCTRQYLTFLSYNSNICQND